MKNTLTTASSAVVRRSAAVLMAGLLSVSLAACGVGSKTEAAEESPSASASEGTDGGTATGDATDDATDDTTGDATGDAAASGEFCDAFDAFTNMSSEVSASDPAAVVASLQGAVDAMKAADAPAEVADDWNTLESVLSEYVAVLQAVIDNPTDVEAMTKMQEGLSDLTSTELTEAAGRVGAYAGVNC